MHTHAFACWLLAASLVAQEPAGTSGKQPARSAPAAPGEPAAPARPGPQPPPVHAAQPELPPAAALDHVRAGNARAAAARARAEALPEPAPRPGGAGRYVMAVLACADADIDVAALFGLRARDVLVVRNAGPHATADDIALLERAVSKERLSLCVVLTHAECGSLRPEAGDGDAGPGPAAAAAARHLEPARQYARNRGVPLHQALAAVLRESLLATSAPIREGVAADRLRVVAAAVDPRTAVVTWFTARADDLPLAPVK